MLSVAHNRPSVRHIICLKPLSNVMEVCRDCYINKNNYVQRIDLDLGEGSCHSLLRCKRLVKKSDVYVQHWDHVNIQSRLLLYAYKNVYLICNEVRIAVRMRWKEEQVTLE